MKFLLASAALLGLALASPTKVLNARSTTFCGQWGSVETGTYTVYNDLWGESSATSGSQCTTVSSDSGTTLKWSTSWTWEGGSSDVKSYANAVLTQSYTKLSALSTIPSTFHWR